MGERIGKDSKSGHYTCLFKCNNKWYYYNDSPKVNIDEYDTLDDVLKNQSFKHLKIRMLYYI
jgi:ubiquitin C-terminal hydrolase